MLDLTSNYCYDKFLISEIKSLYTKIDFHETPKKDYVLDKDVFTNLFRNHNIQKGGLSKREIQRYTKRHKCRETERHRYIHRYKNI